MLVNFAGHKRGIMRSPSLNISRERYRNDAIGDEGSSNKQLATTTASDEELLLAIEFELELEDCK